MSSHHQQQQPPGDQQPPPAAIPTSPPEREARPRGPLQFLRQIRPQRLPSVTPGSSSTTAIVSPSPSPSPSPSAVSSGARFPHSPSSNLSTTTGASSSGGRLQPPGSPHTIEEILVAITPPLPTPLLFATHLSYAQILLSHLTSQPSTAVSLTSTSITPILSSLCSSSSPSALRHVGYEILSAYITCLTSTSQLSNLDRATFWSILRASPEDEDEWEVRSIALSKLTRDAREVEGLEGLISIVGAWAETAAGKLSYEDEEKRGEIENRLSVSLKFLTEMLKCNAGVLRPAEVSALLGLFDRILNAALRTPDVPVNMDVGSFAGSLASSTLASPIAETPGSAVGLAMIPYSPSSFVTPSRSGSGPRPVPTTPSPITHRRHPSSQSFSPTPSTPTTPNLLSTPTAMATTGLTGNSLPPAPIQPLYTLPAQLYLTHIAATLECTLVPSADLPQIMTTLTLLLSYVLSPLPSLTTSARYPHTSVLEVTTSGVIRTLISGPYSTTTTRLLKKLTYPPPLMGSTSLIAARCAEGAIRSIRLALRRAAETRISRLRLNDVPWSITGAPILSSLDDSYAGGVDLLDKAWGKPASEGSWEFMKIVDVLGECVGRWAKREAREAEREERVIKECVGIAMDVVDELKVGDGRNMTAEEGKVVGEIVANAVICVQKHRCSDGMPFKFQMLPPLASYPSPVVDALARLIPDIPFGSPLEPSLAETLLSISPHLTDTAAVSLIEHHTIQHDISPSSTAWLIKLSELFSAFYTSSRPMSRMALTRTVKDLYESVRDLAEYRDDLLNLCLGVWERTIADEELQDVLANAWFVLGDGVVAIAGDLKLGADEPPIVGRIRRLLCLAARCVDPEPESSQSPPVRPSLQAWDSSSGSSTLLTSASETGTPGVPANTPIATSPTSEKGEQYAYPLPLMALVNQSLKLAAPREPLSRRSTGGTLAPRTSETLPTPHAIPETPLRPVKRQSRSMWAVLTLIDVFARLAFSPPHSLVASTLARAPASFLCVLVFQDLLTLLSPTELSPLPESDPRITERSQEVGRAQASDPKARLAILQLFVRLRADRDHRLYVAKDLDDALEPIASLVRRLRGTGEEAASEASDVQSNVGASATRGDERERSGTKGNRSRATRGDDSGRGAGRARSKGGREMSRSRSRPPSVPTLSPNVAREQLWSVPEVLPFEVSIGTRPSEGMTTFAPNPLSTDSRIWLPTSIYVCVLADIIFDETDWEILSYALCNVPLQLANKHLFCGPRTRPVIIKLAEIYCHLILTNQLAKNIVKTPVFTAGNMGEVQGVAYLGLTTLMSYHPTFDIHLKRAMVDAFQLGLGSGYHTTIKPCLHALSIAAHELQPSMTKILPKTLETLTRIVFNPTVTVHILELLLILGSVPSLYASFNEQQYRLVFAVALQYIQHHNRLAASGNSNLHESFALSQHVIGIAYYVIYSWFLAIKMNDRAKHVSYISRSLLKACELNGEVDGRAEVCFDWLARYTYGNASPRATQSYLGAAIMGDPEKVLKQKTWLLGNSLVTIQVLTTPGWVEITSRRATGQTRFLCLLENVPLHGFESLDEFVGGSNNTQASSELANGHLVEPEGDRTPRVSPSNDQGSTHRLLSAAGDSVEKSNDYTIDPSFMSLMLSPYPDLDRRVVRGRVLPDDRALHGLIHTLDHVPVVNLHKIAVLYVGPGQTTEKEILGNRHGSPAYMQFLSKLGRLIRLKDQKDIYPAGLDTRSDSDGQYAYAWWDDIVQIVYHVATLMPNAPGDEIYIHKKKHLGNDWVRIVWNDSGLPYQFDTLRTQFQFVNIVIEPHSAGAMAAYSSSLHEHDFFKIRCQRAPGMPEFGPIGSFKLISAASLPLFIKQVSLLADFFAAVYYHTQLDTSREEYKTNWRGRLDAVKQYKSRLPPVDTEPEAQILGQGVSRDFTQEF